MSRQVKESIIRSLKDTLAASQASFVVDYKGLDVSNMQSLRSQLREKGGALKVAKVTLMKLAMQDVIEGEVLTPYLQEQVALVFAHQEAPEIAKVLNAFAKDEKISLVAGCFEEKLLDKQAIRILASLPSREVLLAQVCGAMQAPTTNLVVLLNMMTTRLVWVLKQASEKKSN